MMLSCLDIVFVKMFGQCNTNMSSGVDHNQQRTENSVNIPLQQVEIHKIHSIPPSVKIVHVQCNVTSVLKYLYEIPYDYALNTVARSLTSFSPLWTRHTKNYQAIWLKTEPNQSPESFISDNEYADLVSESMKELAQLGLSHAQKSIINQCQNCGIHKGFNSDRASFKLASMQDVEKHLFQNEEFMKSFEIFIDA